jgi:acyl-CoA synthetase (AMP-forming)/AMP-acid ligase II
MAQDLVAFLHETADRFGAKTALLMKLGIRYRTWSYDDMWAESGRVASLLQAKGVQPGDRVAIWGPNSPQWVFAFFGSMRAGAIPVPIDLRSDEQFVARIAEKSRPTMGFASRFAPGAGSAPGVDVVLLEELEAQTKALGEPAPSSSTPTTWLRSCLPLAPPATPKA